MKVLDQRIIFVAGLIICSVTVRSEAQSKRAVLGKITAVDPKVLITLCLGSGSLTIRGWDRSEARVQPADRIRPILHQEQDDSDTAQTLELVGSMPEKKCVDSGDIELDVPRESGIDLHSGHAQIKISGVARLKITNEDGSIDLAQIGRSTEINSIAGHILVRDSRGSIKLYSAGGSIQVQDVKRNETGEVCQATSVGGDVTLDDVDHALVSAGTVNGILSFGGPLVWAGRYHFQTMLGNIKMSLPSDSSFRIGATLPRGASVKSDFLLQMASTPVTSAKVFGKASGKMQYLYAAHGTADIFIQIESFAGQVYLIKR